MDILLKGMAGYIELQALFKEAYIEDPRFKIPSGERKVSVLLS